MTSGSGIPVLVVDNYDSFTFNLTALVRESGGECTVIRNDEISGRLLSQFQKVLISPGPGTPSAAGGICDLIRTQAPVKSILGVCLGHQAIAEVFGCRLRRLDSPDHGVSRRVRPGNPRSRLFDRLPAEFEAGFYHSWEVDPGSISSEIVPTAHGCAGEVMALSHRIHDVHGLQFHPESIMTPAGRTIIENWLRSAQSSSTANSESGGRLPS